VYVCVHSSGARQPPLVGAVEALVEGRAGSPEFDSYAVFDPKVREFDGACKDERVSYAEFKP